ncbi:hypothetical protein JR316_0012805 [Psilocybe cubensis]|uniref:Uncharacterized protein n=2 Tax=Psilocybe cubensis TaxID=181762 RepID=A0ACB8GG27_PSICU|nr:hypothetical protein JR316_0012805 [Psilocybe cubensis]KAH9474347.1 hypothetical protein JR316_0012805 [Psilocybe cubensis]
MAQTTASPFNGINNVGGLGQAGSSVSSSYPYSSNWSGNIQKSKLWRCGDPYRYPFPESEGDPWNCVLEPYRKNDRIQCEAWKDEVQNLLIFAGLFSAVVTAFTVESYKNLQPDPNDTIVYLLAQLVDSSSNVSNVALPPPIFVRSASALRVNIFWFLSLVLSLTTVLVGIVGLQWIREHQQYTDEIDPRNSLSVFRMRSHGLREWFVPQIFTGLPLLLQSAVFLFLIGIIDFLYSLDHTVSGWITVAVALTLLFLLATTALPTMQLFVPHDGQHTIPPTQCPYRSPQARIFMVITTRIYTAVMLLDAFIPFRKFRRIKKHFAARFALRQNFKSWIAFDAWWLNIREAHIKYRHAPKFDGSHNIYNTISLWQNASTLPTELEAEALLDALDQYSHNDAVVFALYHCFSEVAKVQNSIQFELFQRYYIQATGLPYRETYWPSRLMPPFDSSTSRLLHHENMVWFLLSLGRNGHSKRVEAHIVPHLIELKTRITAYTMITCRSVIKNTDFLDYSQEHMHFALGKPDGNYLAYSAFGEPNFRYPVSDVMYQETLNQAYLIYERFTRKVAMIKESTKLEETTYNHMICIKFLDIPMSLLRHDMWAQDTAISLHPILYRTLQFMVTTLDRVVSENTERPLLFLSASYVLNRILQPLEGAKEHYTSNIYYRTKNQSDILPWIVQTPIIMLMEALIRYHDHFHPTRCSPFSLRQLSYERIFLWKLEPGAVYEFKRYVEIPRDPVLDS